MEGFFFLILSLALTSVALAGILFSSWKNMGRAPHALSWALAFGFGAIQWTGNLMRGLFPTQEAYWLTVSALSLAVASFGLRGHAQRVQSGISDLAITVGAGACFCITALATTFSPHFGLMLGVVPAYGAVTLWISAWLIVRGNKALGDAERGCALVLGLFGAFQAAAATAALMNGFEQTPVLVALYRQLNFLAMPALYTAAGLFAVFLITSDLATSLRKAAVQDQLTGLLNRRGFAEANAKIYAAAQRMDTSVSVIMMDIDHFKSINDTHGHTVGDEAIVHFAQLLQNGRRAEDVVARIGGEEFAIVLPGAGVEESMEVARRLRSDLASAPLVTRDLALEMTASFGVATLSQTDTCLSDMIVRADNALYQSKQKGRNRVDLEASAITLMPDGSLMARRTA